jgi:exodeoxyribonuclease V alpha subunit
VETLEGTVSKVIFREANGYAVVQLSVEGRLLPVVVVGNLASVQQGETLQVSGEWTRHPRFGDQFKIAQFRSTVPASNDGLVRYLSSGLVSGIGPALAERLVQHFGGELFNIAERQPERLTEVEGIGTKRAEAIAGALAAQRSVREVMVFLQGLGLGPGLAGRIHRAWGDQTIARLRADPYMLVREVEGFGFATADAVARRLGVEPASGSRLEAGLLHVLWAAHDEGHTVLPVAESLSRAARFLDADEALIAGALEELTRQGVLAQRSVGAEATAHVGLSGLVAAEEGIARRLISLLRQPPRVVDEAAVTSSAQLELTDEQRRAVRLAAEGPVAVITGGPGTGKTTIQRTLVRLLEKLRLPYSLCAPTGRAAKRLAEATGAAACTVHRLLGYGGGRFEHGRDSPLPCGTVVVDEASMLDAPLMSRLVAALGEGSHLVLVGDADQLPSVGPGNVLADVIASGIVPVVRLRTLFRQAEKSRIVLGAHRIREGQLPEASPAGASSGGELHLVRASDPQRVQELVVEICADRIPRAFGLDPRREIQVLSPMHRGLAGTVALNQVLQARLNPTGPSLSRRGEALRVGDKVMQVRNDYDRDVFNGDVGQIVAVDPEGGGLQVEIDGATVSYSAEQLEQISLAYCVSIHKSQGSEYPAVVVPLLTQHYVLLQRNLLYTAVTRARSLVVLVCSDEALRLAVSRVDQARRCTLLASVLARPAA